MKRLKPKRKFKRTNNSTKYDPLESLTKRDCILPAKKTYCFNDDFDEWSWPIEDLFEENRSLFGF